MQYSQTLLDDIRAAVDIVDLVSRFVNLRKAGSHWKGLCPFHTEKTPSFTVNPRKSIFHCFGCGVGGDAFGFVMRQDRLSFPEAVRALAKTAGVALPDEHGARSGDSGREELLRVMELAGRFFADTLWKPAGERARAYLGERGIDTGIARHFGLGYAPEGWESLLTFMRGEKVSEEALIATGLAVARENRAGAYDRFRGRLLFPIRDLQGRVVAFGGRGFGDEQPKYLNSPETPLYIKGNLLYAADLARPTIQSQNRALLVEGYVDCIMAHQHGFTGAVAALGTAFTRVALLLAKVADGDEAAALSREAAAKLGVDPTQLWIEAQRLQSSLRTPPAQSQPSPPASMPSVERDLVALLLYSAEARGALLGLLGESDELGHAPLRAIVDALKHRPDASAESLMPDLPTDEARSVLSSLLVEDRESVDARVSIGQFQRRLERSQRLRRAREVSQAIAETQAKTGVAAPMHAELRTLHKESAVVYEITGGIAQSLEHGTSTSPRSSDE